MIIVAYRSIFHVRLQDFELQAERMIDVGLMSRAIAIISSHHVEGTIIILSDEARQEGLLQGMKVSLARKISRGTCFLPYNRSPY